MWYNGLRTSWSIGAVVAAALLAASCADDTGPGQVLYGSLGVAPVFSPAAGIVPVTAGRFVLRRTADAAVVMDTVITIAAQTDSVDLTLTVPLTQPGETFQLTIALVGSAEDTVFRAGPLTVTPIVGTGTPPVIPVPVVYTGVGADAASVVILVPDAPLFFGQQLTLQAVVLDSAGQPIPNTPVEWRSLDSTRVRVARPDSGRVIAQPLRGPARIVARLLTDQADTVQLLSQPTPSSIVVSSGNNQSAPPGTALELPLVAQVLAADAGGVADVWVRFTVTAGGGTLGNGNPVDSALTGADGRAQTFLTLGPGGPQVVEATTPQLPNLSALFNAAVLAGTQVTWANPSGGLWSVGANWSTGAPPGPLDTAVIALGGTYTVTLDLSTSVGGLTLGGGTGSQTLDAAGPQSLTLTGDGAIGPTGRLNLVNGDLLLAGGNVLALTGGGVRVGPGHSLVVGLADPTQLTYAGGTVGGPGVLFLNQGTQLNLQTPLSLDSLILQVNDATVADAGAGRLVIQPDAALLLHSQTGTNVNVVVENHGVVSALGAADVLSDSLLNVVGSTLQMAATGTGAALTVGALVNAGTVLMAGGVPSTLTVAGAGEFVNRAAGDVTVLPGATHLLNATLVNQGTMTVAGGLTVNRATAQHRNTGHLTVATGQTLAITGGTFTNARILGGPTGTIDGDGTFDLSGTSFINDGLVAPGTSPGFLTLVGNPTLSASSEIRIELGGTAPGTEYDRFAVTGAVTTGGALNVELIPGFTPTPGDQFTIMTFSSPGTGDFASVSFPALPAGLGWAGTASPTSIVLEVIPQVVFVGEQASQAAAVMLVSGDGQSLTPVQAIPPLQGNNRFHPRWAPDLSRLAYGLDVFPSPNLLHVSSADGLEDVVVVSDTSVQFSRWSPDGRHLAFQCGAVFGSQTNQDVCVVPNVDRPIPQLDVLGNGTYDGTRGKVFVTDFDLRGWPFGSGAFAWDRAAGSPGVIAFVRDSMDAVGLPHSMIFTSLFDGSNPRPLVSAGGYLMGPNGPLQVVTTMDWSEDGAFLVFAARNPQGEQGLYFIRRDGTGLRQLTGGAQDERPVISPDGRQVFFLRTNGQLITNFHRVDVATGAVTQVGTDNFGDFNPADLGYDYSPNGTDIVIAAWETAFGNVRIYVISPTTEAFTYLSDRRPIGRTPPVREFQPSWRP